MASNLSIALTNAVLASISQPDYSVDPPKLSPELWDRVCVLTPEAKAENERLEFLGDALMDACFAIELYTQVPNGTPHMYTEIRSALHRNLAFCHLANRMGVTTSGPTKTSGDVFETLMGAYYTEKGFDALCEWTRRAYEPIMRAAIEAFLAFYRGKRTENVGDELSGAMSSCSLLQSPYRASTSPIRDKGKRRPSTSMSLPRSSSPLSPSSRRPHSINLMNGSVANTQQYSPSEHSPQRGHIPDTVCSTPLQVGEQLPVPELSERLPRDPASDPRSTESLQANVPYMLPPSEDRPRATPLPMSLEDIPLPDFWEEVQTLDGKVFYVDHERQTTTWDDPRRKFILEDRNVDSSSDWTARLMTPLPEIPETPTEGITSLHNDSNGGFQVHAAPMHDELAETGTLSLFPDLLQEGYILESSEHSFLPSGHAVPEFCETRQGGDGQIYFIDHISATITGIRQAPA